MRAVLAHRSIEDLLYGLEINCWRCLRSSIVCALTNIEWAQAALELIPGHLVRWVRSEFSPKNNPFSFNDRVKVIMF